MRLAKRRDRPLTPPGSSSAQTSISPASAKSLLHHMHLLTTYLPFLDHLRLRILFAEGTGSWRKADACSMGDTALADCARPSSSTIIGIAPARDTRSSSPPAYHDDGTDRLHITCDLNMASPVPPRSHAHTKKPNQHHPQHLPSKSDAPSYSLPSGSLHEVFAIVKSGPHVSVMDMCGLRGSGCPASGEPQGEPNPGLCHIRLYGPS